MFTLLGIIILLVIALALLMNYFLCRDFYSCWKEYARTNWQVQGKPSFNEFYQNQLGLFRTIVLGSELDCVGSQELVDKRKYVRWTWLVVLTMLFSGCALVGFEADLRPSKWAIIPIDNIRF
ncbi:hypothetical protein RC856_003366 [Vibrio fluvialis]|nr:hypothetical protein [Vibrio fluvialis]